MSKPIRSKRSSWQKDMDAFQSANLEEKRAQYKLRKVIGTGQYATVWRAWDKKRQRTCTVKDIHITRYKCDVKKALHYVLAEIDIMKRIDHPNVLRIYDHYMGVVQREPHVYLVMEYCDGGTLKQWLREHNAQASSSTTHRRYKIQMGSAAVKKIKPLPPNVHPMVRPSWELTCRHMVRQIVAGYKALHEQKIMHRDLKPENILLVYRLENDDEQQTQRHANLTAPVIKLADFGFSKVLQENGGENVMNLAHTFCGTPYYMAPEVFEDAGYSDKADCWSLGVMIYEMMENKRPFERGLRNVTQMHEAAKNLTLTFPRAGTPLVWRDFVSHLLTVDVAKRISWHDIFTHPIFGSTPGSKRDASLARSCPILIHKPNACGAKHKTHAHHWRNVVYDVQAPVAFSLPLDTSVTPASPRHTPTMRMSGGGGSDYAQQRTQSAPSEPLSRLVKVDNYFALILSQPTTSTLSTDGADKVTVGSPHLQFQMSQEGV